MRTMDAIQQAIQRLHSVNLAKFRSWFAKFDAVAWDQQIEADAAAGKLDALAAEALAEYQHGTARDL